MVVGVEISLFSLYPIVAAMSLKSNDESHFDQVPGTEILYDEGPDGQEGHSHLKHRMRGDARVLLVPQPSRTDANDPLNWSTWKKNLTFFNGCWYAFMGAITGPIMAAGMCFSMRQF